MRSTKKKLLLPLLAAVIALGAAQSSFAGLDNDDCDWVPTTNPTDRVPDGGATAFLLIGAGVGLETLRRRFIRS